jgi:hypothetical protein
MAATIPILRRKSRREYCTEHLLLIIATAQSPWGNRNVMFSTLNPTTERRQPNDHAVSSMAAQYWSLPVLPVLIAWRLFRIFKKHRERHYALASREPLSGIACMAVPAKGWSAA